MKAALGFNFSGGIYIHLDNLLFELGHPADVLRIKATVHIEKASIFNCQFKLPRLLAATIQEDFATLETNLQGQTYLGHTNFNYLGFSEACWVKETNTTEVSTRNQDFVLCATAGLNQSQFYLISRNSNSAQALVLYDGQ